jgi:hypothetical protein
MEENIKNSHKLNELDHLVLFYFILRERWKVKRENEKEKKTMIQIPILNTA